MIETCILKCTACNIVYSVPSNDPDINLLDKNIRCPLYPCTGAITKLAETTIPVKAIPVKAVELYQAYVLGFPDQHTYSLTDILNFINGKRISRVELDQGLIETRPIIRSITIEIDDNRTKTIHLASSTAGVIILKITEDALCL